MEDETRLINQPPAGAPGDTTAHNAEVRVTPDRGTADTTPDPGAARAQIEQTRARMSETIDEIEDVLVRKKEQLQDRLDVLAPVRERPLASLGIVLGAGVVLGLLTGGDDDHGGARVAASASLDPDLEERAETWERRARRLMRIAREQEEELNALSTGRAVRITDKWDDEELDDEAGSAPSAIDNFRDEVAEKVTEFVTGAVRGLFGGNART